MCWAGYRSRRLQPCMESPSPYTPGMSFDVKDTEVVSVVCSNLGFEQPLVVPMPMPQAPPPPPPAGASPDIYILVLDSLSRAQLRSVNHTL